MPFRRSDRQTPAPHLRLHTLPYHGVHEDGEGHYSEKGHDLSTSRDVCGEIMGSSMGLEQLLLMGVLRMVNLCLFRYERFRGINSKPVTGVIIVQDPNGSM